MRLDYDWPTIVETPNGWAIEFRVIPDGEALRGQLVFFEPELKKNAVYVEMFDCVEADALRGQHCCRTVVHGELDWSPAVHDQANGRVHRDGQKEPVIAYYMQTDSGSDPVIADTLGLKRQQASGIRDPSGAAFVPRTDENAIASLAEAYLRQTGK